MTTEHQPTEDQRRQVETASGMGLPHEQIASIIGIDDKTLRKHYRDELDKGKANANLKVSQCLFDKATSGDTTAAIWWTKAQMGWSERQKLEHSGGVSVKWMG